MRASWTAGAAFALVLAVVGQTHATQTLYVDDDGLDPFNCTGAPYRTITQALAVASDGDEIRVCPGVYREQVTVTRSVGIIGETFGTRRAVIQPGALPATTSSLWSTNPIAGAVTVDTKFFRMSNIDIDLADNALPGCSPMLVGLYLRNTSGRIERMEVRNARLPLRPDCESGVGIFAESGPTEYVLGQPINGTARVSLQNVTFAGYQKAGFAAHGPRTVISMKQATATGSTAAAGASVGNGFEFAFGARGKLVDAVAQDHATLTAGKVAAGVLGFEFGKTKIRLGTFTGNQVGVFVVGDRARIKRSVITDSTSDGVVLFGDANVLSATEINHSSVSGCFVNGDRNLVRGSFIANSEFGLWFIAGFGNAFYATSFQDIDLATRGVFGGVRDLTPAAAAPFLTACETALACDDGNACTTDLCDVTAGVCSHGVTVCDDGTTCTTDTCDPVVGCVFTPTAPGPCNDASVCTTGDTCVAGVCVGTPTPAAQACAVGNGTVCDGIEQCNPVTGLCESGVPLTCDDANACTADTCDATLGCQAAPVPNGTPCGAGICTAGVCL